MKIPKIDEISVFFPAYNEESNLTNTVTKAEVVLEKVAKKWEIIIINDGSKDDTLKIANTLVKKNKNIKVINHSQNRGYGAALKSGLYGSKYDLICFTDSDGQFDFKEVSRLYEKMLSSKSDLVIGYYLHRKVPFYRIWGSFVWQLAVFILFGLKVRDIDCGFKILKKKVVDTIPKLESERGPFISSEFLIKAKKARFKIVELGVNHYPRKSGEATGAKLNVILSGLVDLFRLWLKINFTAK
jgi:glycosyltransferase involved in cell wall biosynthesis